MNLVEATILALRNKLQETTDDYETTWGDDEEYKIKVYQVCMNTYTGKRLYLCNKSGTVWFKDAKRYDWTFNPNEGAMWKSKEEAEKFAKKYFKYSNKWYIYETYVSHYLM